MIRNAVVIAAVVAVLLVLAHFLKPRHNDQAYTFAIVTSYRAGDVYSVRSDDHYKIVKILVVDQDAVHIRVYKNSFAERPTRVDLATLSLGTIHDRDGFGIGHLPISLSEFSRWEPELITQAEVTPEELDGYEEWKKDKGGVFGR